MTAEADQHRDRPTWVLPDGSTIWGVQRCLTRADLQDQDQFILVRGWGYLLLVFRPSERGHGFMGWVDVREIPHPPNQHPYTSAREYHERTGKGLTWTRTR